VAGDLPRSRSLADAPAALNPLIADLSIADCGLRIADL
jgi:hypothetical protein